MSPNTRNEPFDSELEAKLVQIISEVSGISVLQIKPNSRLADDLGLDSFSLLDLGYGIERAFPIKIQDTEVKNIKTVRDLYLLVSKQLKGRKPSGIYKEDTRKL